MRKWLGLILLCVFLSGCGIRFLYNNVDWLVIEYLDDHVELERDQEEWLSNKVAILSEWHRRHEIPHYIEHLDQLISLDLATFSSQDLAIQKRQFQQHGERLLSEIEPKVLILASQLNDEQVNQFMKNLRVRHGKYQDKYQDLNEDEIRQRYAERIAENLEQWLGDLTKEQEVLIQLWTSEMEITVNDWVSYQTQVRLQIKEMLAQRTDTVTLERKLNSVLTDPQRLYSSELNRKLEHNRQVMDLYFVQLVNIATDKQARHYRETLEDWKEVALDIMQ
ncbi:DUF6279 family lipoprotein [Vibrio agarivorans]|uniref:DUF6279 family lipoprotein n=1 Tax=Vibrio agarivorans TaxID=153622 RepID=A0ABT7Y3V3_9VIBR|nr:DUF6279 family lipoprotein [Vibrio agarivorans]MDN2482728.1 DUF6279 family lipoprotein [Vibrio agarivorans]